MRIELQCFRYFSVAYRLEGALSFGFFLLSSLLKFRVADLQVDAAAWNVNFDDVAITYQANVAARSSLG